MLSCMYQCSLRTCIACGIILDCVYSCRMQMHWSSAQKLLIQAICNRLAFKRGTCAAVRFNILPAGSPGLLLLLKKTLEP